MVTGSENVVLSQLDVREESSVGDGRLPFAFAKRHGVLLGNVGESSSSATLFLRPGASRLSVSEVRRRVDRPLRLEYLSVEEFDNTLQDTYESGSSRAMELMGDLGEEADLSRIAQELPEPEDLLESEDDAPIIRLLNALFTEAVKEDASDIHIESYEHRLAIRFRVDGVLRDILEPPRVLAPLIVSRVKVMARLDIAEKRLPQDGRISLRIAGRAVDVRVSTLPSGYGERVVLRLLDKQGGRLDLEHLGMDGKTRERIDSMICRPHGIILVTGPTGSGKTTTLYAALSRINDRRRNIMTVEDPIEYYLDGISQTHVNTRVDLTFARGLRAILRQDPDVVMVGEIRDLETAEIAVQASLTGHLVFSTLHTNSAIGAVTRLRDMGVEPYLLSSSLVGVVAQRLVRLLCPSCKRTYTATPVDCAELWLPATNPPTLYEPAGCSTCNFIGYRGRTGIYELVDIDDKMRTMIHDGLSEQEMELHARSHSKSIQQDGIQKVLAGDTSLEEVLRVTRTE